ncbi:DnaD domain-containing protein [Aquibacillus salsiterrae]|uniref:DnaD domain protein n=1 Tax=Aquibacillus salsiterrae TaxID=2950439 RepID=A0A9X3WG72_9BACI|nr:DnaD domain protein [Aquibacillus salsiterrae]MDC3418068.1 DnaD domain protein [Aquibacillus salsiterrae]
MNYIREVNAFKDWMSLHELPACAALLWHTLMMVNNVARWEKFFNAPNRLIENLSGLSVQRISEARKVLVDHGLISYQAGVKGKAPIYQMLSLVSYYDQVSPAEVEQTGVITEQSPEQLPEPFQEPFRSNRRNIHKQNETNPNQNRGGGKEPSAFSVYEQNFGILKPILQESLQAWCHDLGDEIVVAAMKQAVKKGGRTYSYVEAILKEWVQANITTLEQAKNYEQQKHKQPAASFFVQQRKSNNKALLDDLRRECTP